MQTEFENRHGTLACLSDTDSGAAARIAAIRSSVATHNAADPVVLRTGGQGYAGARTSNSTRTIKMAATATRTRVHGTC